MRAHKPIPIALLAILLGAPLGGCQAQATPEQVARDFWQAMIAGDEAAIERLSDKAAQPEPDRAALPPLAAAELGAAAVAGDTARVPVELTLRDASARRLPAQTILRRTGQGWQVDYAASTRLLNLHSDVTAALADLRRLGEELARGADEAATQIEQALPSLEAEIRRLEDELRTQLPIWRDRIENFRKRLEDALKAPPQPPADPDARPI